MKKRESYILFVQLYSGCCMWYEISQLKSVYVFLLFENIFAIFFIIKYEYFPNKPTFFASTNVQPGMASLVV